MQLKSLLTAAIVASSFLLDGASATGHEQFGKFGQKARDRLDRKKDVAAPAHNVERRSTKDFRFLTKNTQREVPCSCLCLVILSNVSAANFVPRPSLFCEKLAGCRL